MKKITFGLFLFLCFISVFSQTNTYWLQSEGSLNIDENLGIAKDNNNNLITVGYFTNTMTFSDGTSLTSFGSGTNDALIQKTDVYGNKQWAVKAGGLGSDRAVAVACDAIGNIYVTGYYYGTAQFGSFTLNSVSSSQDIFIAKLDPSGTFLWAKSAGGSMAEDPYSLAVDINNNVIITGEFQGISIFGSQTLISAINPYTNLYSFDVFTCKYDQSGGFLWAKQGSAHLDDRGLDVATDALGNVFVCGQFSDTITFDNTHLNQIQNAAFIIKYNSSGQEQWFVRAGATGCITNALTIDGNNNVYVTGDYTGNLIFYGIPNNFLYGTYTNRVFLVKYSNSGAYLWGKEDASNSYVSSKDVAIDNVQRPCIYGEFDCKMDEYSLLAGGTGMFNSVGFHDLFITSYDENGTRLWARNFGGPMYDKAHGVVFTNNSTPYVCGSFQKTLSINSNYAPSSISPISWISHNPISDQSCNHAYYQSVNAEGFSDCFIMHGIDGTSPYYDYYYRNGIGCYKDFVGGCIDDYTYSCPDTIPFCGTGTVTANPYSGDIGGIAPLYHYHWNTGDTTNYRYVTTSGNYSCVMNTIDGCFSSEDTVYVKINPIPQPPTITDNLGINVNQPPLTYSVEICEGTVTLTGGNLQSCSYQWSSASGLGIVSTNSTSCVVNQTGYYYFTLTNSFGCTNYNQIYVQIDTLNHVEPKTNMIDTFMVCQGDCISYFIYDSLSNPTGVSYPPFTSLNHVNTSNPVVSWCCNSPSYNNLSLNICPVVTGTINLHTQYIFSSLCGKDTAYFNKIIFVKVNPKPQISLNFVGNTFICPNDSSLLVASVTVTPSANMTYTITPNDSIWVHPGYYYSSVYATDTLTHCSNSTSSYINVQTVNNPYVHTVPTNGIICPHDSVELICNWPTQTAISWQWYGPTGILPPNAQYIYDSIPGFYYCVATNADGCQLTSNTVEIKQYNTPYLIALPQTVVCAGNEIELHVISNDTTFIQWLPPLSGGGTTKTVSSSGTYSCQVTMCGITTICSMSVTVAQPIAHISVSGSTTICPGDSVLLQANAGMISYSWLPTNQTMDSMYAYASGTYVLMATDAYGCQAKDSITITYNPNAPVSPTASNDSICYGNMSNLQATISTSNIIQWYAQPYGGSVIYTGNNYTTPLLYTDTVFYVADEDGSGCHSLRSQIDVFIKPTSFPPIISVNKDSLCFGDTLNLYANIVAGATYNWSGPNSFSSPQINPQLINVTAAGSGTYSLFINGSSCTSPTATLNIVVTQVSTPNIIVTNDSICSSSSLVLQAQSSTAGVSYSWTGVNNFSSFNPIDTIINMSILNAGMYYVQTNIGVCKSAVDSVKITVKSTPIPIVYIQQNACLGDSLMLMAQTDSTSITNWVGPSGFQSNLQMPVLTNLTADNSGYYVCSTTFNGCTGKDSAKVLVNALPNFTLGNDTTTCSSTPITLYPGHFEYYIWNDTLTDSTHIVQNSGQITLTVFNQFGCHYSDTINVVVAECLLVSPNIFTPNGDGVNDVFSFKIDHYKTLDFNIYDRWGKLVYKNQNSENNWDGINIQTKKVVDDGVYFYHVDAKTMLGTNASDNGFIQVLK